MIRPRKIQLNVVSKRELEQCLQSDGKSSLLIPFKELRSFDVTVEKIKSPCPRRAPLSNADEIQALAQSKPFSRLYSEDKAPTGSVHEANNNVSLAMLIETLSPTRMLGAYKALYRIANTRFTQQISETEIKPRTTVLFRRH